MSRWITTFFGVGLLPKLPGTWGSLAALPCAILLHLLGGFPALLIATIIIFLIGWWATDHETRGKANHDPGEIVIDEVAGQWIALFPLSGSLWYFGVPIAILPWPGLLVAFLLFRFFDIIKPWPVSWADRKKIALGVMLDDVIAGVMAAVVLSILGALAHGYF